MGDTSIEWTQRPGTKGASWNPIVAYRDVVDPQTGQTKWLRGWYCEHATTGCIKCYSERQNIAGARGGTKLPYKPGHRKDVSIEIHEPTLLQPLKWRKPHTVFVCSMTDLFGEFHSDEMIDNVFAVMALSPQHTFQVLTKRAERMRDYVAEMTRQEWWKFRIYDKSAADAASLAGWPVGSRPTVYPDWPLPNVWLGISAERQQEADERIPLLLQTPAAVRFVSLEPLLGAIDLGNLRGGTFDAITGCGDRERLHVWEDTPRLDWVIVGGESGPKARPMHPQWARDLRDQCTAAGVPFFFKQWGQHAQGTINSDIMVARNQVHHFMGAYRAGLGSDGSYLMCNVGKKAAGRLLDGVEHSEFPDTSQRERSAA